MMTSLRSFWRLVNAPAVNPQTVSVSGRAFWRALRKYFLQPYLGSCILIVVFGSLVGGLSRYFWAWTGRFIADDIVQVQLLAKDTPPAATLDPTQPGENREFALDEPRERLRVQL